VLALRRASRDWNAAPLGLWERFKLEDEGL
jgi:hypothetical protein